MNEETKLIKWLAYRFPGVYKEWIDYTNSEKVMNTICRKKK